LLTCSPSRPAQLGREALDEQRFDWNAVIERLDHAGAVLLGTVAMIELAGGLGYRPLASLTGATRNPGTRDAELRLVVGLARRCPPVRLPSRWVRHGSIICPPASAVSAECGRRSAACRHGAMALSWTSGQAGTAGAHRRTVKPCCAPSPATTPDEWSAMSRPVAAAGHTRDADGGAIRPDPERREGSDGLREAVKALGARA
jgi:hypothetical protein